MLHLPHGNVAIDPIFDPDTTPSGRIYIPDIAKERCDQGIVKYIGIDSVDEETGNPTYVGGLHPGDYVIFSGYSGQLIELEDEGLLIIMPIQFIVAKVNPPISDMKGLFFQDDKGNYITATYEIVTKIIAMNFQDAEWRRQFNIITPNPMEGSNYA